MTAYNINNVAKLMNEDAAKYNTATGKFDMSEQPLLPGGHDADSLVRTNAQPTRFIRNQNGKTEKIMGSGKGNDDDGEFRHDPYQKHTEDTRPLSSDEQFEKFQTNGKYDSDWANADYKRRDDYRRTSKAKYAKATPRPGETTTQSTTGLGKGGKKQAPSKPENPFANKDGKKENPFANKDGKKGNPFAKKGKKGNPFAEKEGRKENPFAKGGSVDESIDRLLYLLEASDQSGMSEEEAHAELERRIDALPPKYVRSANPGPALAAQLASSERTKAHLARTAGSGAVCRACGQKILPGGRHDYPSQR